MSTHRIARADLDVALVQIVRSGEHIDLIHLDGDEWVVITEDRIETRHATTHSATGNMIPWSETRPTHADRLGVKR